MRLNYRVFFLICCLLFCAFAVQSQKRLFFKVQSESLPCEEVPKQIVIRNTNGDVLIKETSLACNFNILLSNYTNDVVLSITTQLFDSVSLKVSIAKYTSDSIVLDDILLKEHVSKIDEVTITGVKRKFIEVDADKTTVTIKDNPILEIASLYDAILKLPGVMPFPGGGFVVGSQMANVYFDNIPNVLSTDDLMNLLKSLPANTAEKIEIISNPGASYDANLTGSIINILSHNKPNKWLSGTLTVGYGFNQNQKFSPSLILDGRRTKWTWQLQTGYSYNESRSRDTSNRLFNTFVPVLGIRSDRNEKNIRSYYYVKPSVNFIFSKRTSLSLSYNGSFGDNRISGNSVTEGMSIQPPISASQDYKSRNYGIGNQGTLLLRHEFDTLKRTVLFTAFYNNYQNTSTRKNSQFFPGLDNFSLLDYSLNIHRFYTKVDFSVPFSRIKLYVNSGLKYSLTKINNIGSYNINNSSASVFDNKLYNSVIDFDFSEDNMAAYVELKKHFGKKISIGAGVRAENYTVRRKSNVSTQQRNDYFNLFPSVNVLYRASSILNIIGSYSRKIGIPSFSQYDPNNTGYYDAFTSSTGNPLLRPNFYDNAEFKVTLLDYIEVSFSLSHSQFLNLSEVVVQPNSTQVLSSYKTYKNVNGYSAFAALPVPFAFFTKGLKMLDEPIEVDNMSFLYLYANYTKTTIEGYQYQQKNKGFVTFGVYSQFILPAKIRLNVDYYISGKGIYQIYEFYKNRTSFDLIVSRDFLQKKLRVSLSAEDIFNMSQSSTRVLFPNIEMNSYSKTDTRVIRAKISYSFGKVEKKNESDLGIPDKSKGIGVE